MAKVHVIFILMDFIFTSFRVHSRGISHPDKNELGAAIAGNWFLLCFYFVLRRYYSVVAFFLTGL